MHGPMSTCGCEFVIAMTSLIKWRSYVRLLKEGPFEHGTGRRLLQYIEELVNITRMFCGRSVA